MGWGDEIMVTATVRRVHAGGKRKVAVRHKRGGAAWHPIWENNPRMATPAEVAIATPVIWIDERSGCRPYIDYAAVVRRERYGWKAYGPEPGEIYLTAEEKRAARIVAGRVLIEPHTKPGGTVNKQWGWARWQALVDRHPEVPWVQIGPPGVASLNGVKRFETRNEREAAAAVSQMRAVVVPEGGLHHAAAALGVPGVVIFGGYIAPMVTGYALHTNLFEGGSEYPLGCGWRTACAHCAAALEAITPARVGEALQAVLAKDHHG